jgi:leucyl-tRNA synthetase
MLKGIKAKVPFTEKEVPIFIADYVLMDYGTGFIMGVPAHDERDYEFAKKFGLEIIEVIKPKNEVEDSQELFTGNGTMINSGEYSGMDSEEFKKIVIEDLEKQGKGKKAVNYKIRDWVFSRQRYWGEPIPLVHTEKGPRAICETENAEEVNEKLPLELPEVEDFSPPEDGASPLERNSDWVNTTFEGKPAKRETNTMPNWAGSCWYYLRYTDPKNETGFADFEKMKYWLPVDKYFGGAEHTTLHLLYSRFWHKFFYDLGLVPTEEPYDWRMNGGMLLTTDGSKMSKSKDNGIDPIDVIENYGADSFRTTICFMGPYDETYPWNPNIIKTVNKLIRNIYSLQEKVTVDKSEEETLRAYHSMIKNISEMIENLKMNTAVSEIMIFVNHIKTLDKIGKDIWPGFLKVLSPFTPFVAEDLWQKFNNYESWKKENSIHLQDWPKYDEKFVHEDFITIPVQVNGKVRSEISIDKNDTEKSIKEKALSDENVLKYTGGKEIRKFIYVKGRIVNIVI